MPTAKAGTPTKPRNQLIHPGTEVSRGCKRDQLQSRRGLPVGDTAREDKPSLRRWLSRKDFGQLTPNLGAMGRLAQIAKPRFPRRLTAAMAVALAAGATITACHGAAQLHPAAVASPTTRTSASPSAHARPRGGVEKRSGLVFFASPSKNI